MKGATWHAHHSPNKAGLLLPPLPLLLLSPRFLDEYDLKVPGGSFKYKKAAEFLMNTIISGIKGIVQDIVTAKEAAASRAAEAESAVTQVCEPGRGSCCRDPQLPCSMHAQVLLCDMPSGRGRAPVASGSQAAQRPPNRPCELVLPRAVLTCATHSLCSRARRTAAAQGGGVTFEGRRVARLQHAQRAAVGTAGGCTPQGAAGVERQVRLTVANVQPMC